MSSDSYQFRCKNTIVTISTNDGNDISGLINPELKNKIQILIDEIYNDDISRNIVLNCPEFPNDVNDNYFLSYLKNFLNLKKI